MAFDICNEAKDKKEILHDGNKLSEPGTIFYQQISWQKSKKSTVGIREVDINNTKAGRY